MLRSAENAYFQIFVKDFENLLVTSYIVFHNSYQFHNWSYDTSRKFMIDYSSLFTSRESLLENIFRFKFEISQFLQEIEEVVLSKNQLKFHSWSYYIIETDSDDTKIWVKFVVRFGVI